jgi:hypothetical protein
MTSTTLTSRLTTCAATIALMIVSSASIAGSHEGPSATVTIKETEVGLLLGGDWGHGTITYNGVNSMFHLGGVKLGGIGVTVSEVSGDVYGLTKIEDFPGIYFKAEAGATAVEGGVGTWVKNDKGVSIHLKAKSKGLALSIGVEGLSIGM